MRASRDMPAGRDGGPVHESEVDRAVATAAAHAPGWAAASLASRIDLIDRLVDSTSTEAEAWVEIDAERTAAGASAAERGRAWTAGPWGILRMLVALRGSLTDLDADRAPRPAGRIREHSGTLGRQAVVPVFPRFFHDRVAAMGARAEVRMQPEIEVEAVPSLQASAYRTSAAGGASVVLGAGNVSSLPVTDTLEQVFVRKRTVVLKVNPANAFLTPHIERVLAPLVDEGIVAVIRGDAEVGERLVRHPDIGAVQVTGSRRTLEAIAFGTGAEGVRRKHEGQPVLDKPIHAELGDIAPVIVVPGPWTSKELAFQAYHLASVFSANTAFNCATPRLLVQHEGWDAREPLLEELASVLSRIEPRSAWYPGAAGTWNRMVDAHETVIEIGRRGPDTVPWAIAKHVDPRSDAACFDDEPFCPFLAETALDAPDAAGFIDRAVEFVNDRLWGTLSATLLVHPASMRDPGVRAAVERAVDRLRYGTVGVNVWAGIGWTLQVAPWGGYPGGTLVSPGSGIGGFAHNPLMLEGIEKTVVRGPFRPLLTPAWFALESGFDRIARSFTAMEARPNPLTMMRIFGHALRS